MKVPPMVGRDRERGAVVGLLDDIHRHGASLVIRGEPGIGKSALLAEAGRTSVARGLVVLTTSRVQSEANLPFAGLHQLLRPALAHLDALPPRQRAALGAAFGLADAGAPEPFLIALAALQLLSEAAARTPVVALAEDAHWLDRPTVDVLAFVARRVESNRSSYWPRSVTATRARYCPPGCLSFTWTGSPSGPRCNCLTLASPAFRLRSVHE